jgi:hypothetical protein
VLSCVLLIATATCVLAQPARGRRPGPAPATSDRSATETFHLDVPAHPLDVVLARPEATSITLSILAYDDREGYVACGLEAGADSIRTPVQRFARGEPVSVVLAGLQPDTRYYYAFHSRAVGRGAFASAQIGTFHTARPPGSKFTFTLTADAHLDGHTSADVYRQTLANIAREAPDFHLDLGNLFMTDKHATRDEAGAQYLAQRYYLGLTGATTPLMLALGTHDGESAKDDDGTDASLAAWSHQLRTRLFPNPVPDEFYSGNATPNASRGLRQNYYAFTWGSALFVVLDPFANSARTRGSRDGWAWSLGLEQYRWLERTLRESRATFKFVFVHNLLCGDAAARGGVEVAMFNEWGGKNTDGTDGFAQHRPGWAEPVHALLVRHHVAAVFKAHDNFYARQELDGIVYLMVPQPSFAGTDRIRDLENYGYKRGVFLGNSGHVRVTVSPEEATIAYVKSTTDARIADTATIKR